MQPSSTSSGSTKIPMHAIPERIVGANVPGDCFGIGERSFLTLTYRVDFSKLRRSITWSSMSEPLTVDFTERWLPQYSHCTDLETYSRQSSLIA